MDGVWRGEGWKIDTEEGGTVKGEREEHVESSEQELIVLFVVENGQKTG